MQYPNGSVRLRAAVVNHFRALLLVPLLVGLAGCGAGAQPSSDESNPAPAMDGPVGREESTKSGDARETAGSVRNTVNAIRAGRPDELWNGLPERYRDDLTTLVHGFAANVPAETWSETITLARRTTQLLRDRRDDFLAHPAFAPIPTVDDRARAALDPNALLRENWSGLLDVADLLLDSDLADREAVRSLDIEAFLQGTGRATVERLLDLAGEDVATTFRADLEAIEVTPVSRDGDDAVVRIGGAGFDPVEHDFRRVGSRWVPATLADAWPETVGTTVEWIESHPFDEATERTWQEQLLAWDAALVRFERAETRPALHAAIDEWLAERAPGPAIPEEPVATDGSVTVVFAGRLDLPTVDAIQATLNAAAADPDLAVSIDKIEGDTTVFDVTNAGPAESFAERLARDPRVAITSRDADRITATWTPQPEGDGDNANE